MGGIARCALSSCIASLKHCAGILFTQYRADNRKILTDALRQKYGLILTPCKRKVRMLVVDNRSFENSSHP